MFEKLHLMWELSFSELDVTIILNEEPEIVNRASVTFINYQVKSTYYGLLKLKELGLKYAIRTRTDMRITSSFFIGMMKAYLEYYPTTHPNQTNRIICLPYYNGSQIRDQFICGHLSDLINYYIYPIEIHLYQNPETELFNRYSARSLLINTEPYLNGKMLNQEQTLTIISKHFIIIDGNQFGIIWSKYNHGLLSNNELANYAAATNFNFKSEHEMDYINWYKLYSQSMIKME